LQRYALDASDQWQRRDQLISALPSATRSAIKKIGSLVEAAVLDHMSEQHHELRNLAGKKLAEVNVDLCNQRAQIRELLMKIDAKDADIAKLEEEKDKYEQRLSMAATETDALKKRIADLEGEEDFRTRMLAMMKEALGEQALTTEGKS